MRKWLRRLIGGRQTTLPSRTGEDVSTQEATQPMERWDSVRLAAVEARLKALPEDAWTPDDHYQMVEWVAQRYLPHDNPLTQREWIAAKVRLKGKVDAALEELRQGGDLGQAEWQRRETERQMRAKLFHEPMPLTEQQVRSVILPLLAQFDFGPSVNELTDQDVQKFTLACRDSYCDGVSTLDRYAIRECQDSIRMHFHPAVLETVLALSANYQLLLRARRSGYTEVKILVPHDCACMAVAFDSKHASVDGLIKAFENGDSRYPVLPAPAASCASTVDPKLCKVSLIALEPVDKDMRGYDEDFQRYLENVLDGGRQELGEAWSTQLNIAPTAL